MKRTISSYAFNPIAGTIDFSSTTNFDVRSLYAVIHQPTGSTLYAPVSGLTYKSITGSVVTLSVSTAGMVSTDPLIVIYDDGIQYAKDSTLQSVANALGGNINVTPQIGGAPLSPTNRLPVEIDADNVVLQLPTGQKTAANSVPVVLSSDGPFTGFTTNFGSSADVPATSDAGTFSFVALFKRALGYLNTVSSAVVGGVLQTANRSNAPRVVSTGSLGAANAAVTVALDGMTTVVIQLAGTWVGTVSWQASIDNAATWFPINMIPYTGGLAVGSSAVNGQWETACGGATHVQAVMTTYTSGSASAIVVGANGTKSVRVGNPAGNPLTIVSGGTVGVDGSVNKTANNAALPNVGAAFASGSIYANYAVVATIPAGSRNYVEIDNLSTGVIVVVRDDGTAASGSAPVNGSIIPLNAAPAVGQPGGGGWTSTTFKGRLQVYAAPNTTPLVTVFQD